ncbi:ABC-type nitrate/sulfonate/bicarbonate transport system permease component [Gracilibacillus halotolerans]|uniref:ABC-type nitrate/sulfonate/bicarbonate transport system permease component n=1 Tax=Gracilibacillus halotolerans TaxID=74386 RepID=A0A841RPX9_9BACI|nr:ABC transporter permease [Gracilibacillus halotolerans]MBB6513235.1 ABC-type nitrate/sulfonate/bicarbonate transport system permease component [Gracilibacillus halotolerans]
MRKIWIPAVFLAFLIVMWEVSTRLFNIESWILPAPSIILQEAVQSWTNYQHHISSTVVLTLSGFAIGVSIGLLIAVLLHVLPFVRQMVYPVLLLSQNIPIIVLAPLLVIWFGYGTLPKIIIITLVCFFPVTIATLDGFRQTNRELVHYMKMAGASKQQMFTKLELPHALPSIFSGLKISATYSVMGAVISEWLGASKGIGVYMTLASSSFRTDRVFVAILLVILLCFILFGAIILIERFVLRWQYVKGENR